MVFIEIIFFKNIILPNLRDFANPTVLVSGVSKSPLSFGFYEGAPINIKYPLKLSRDFLRIENKNYGSFQELPLRSFPSKKIKFAKKSVTSQTETRTLEVSSSNG